MSSTVEAEPLFRSAHAALMFALNYRHGSIKMSGLARAMGGGRTGRGLGGLDGAAQAGMIRAEIERLTPVRRRLLIGRHAPQQVPCQCRQPCCRGWVEGDDWRESVNWLTEYALLQGLTGTVSHYRLRRTLVCRYLGVKESFQAMAAACGVDRDTASAYHKRVSEHFRTEERAATYEIEAALKAAGMVG